MKSTGKSLPKTRNPLVEKMIRRNGSGFHEKPYKTVRKQSRLELKKMVNSLS